MREGRRICAELRAELRGWRTAEALVGHPGALDEDALDDRLPAEGALVPKLLLPLVDALLVEGDRPAAEERPPPWDCARAAALRRRHRRLRRDHRLEAPLALRRRRVGEEGLPALDVHLPLGDVVVLRGDLLRAVHAPGGAGGKRGERVGWCALLCLSRAADARVARFPALDVRLPLRGVRRRALLRRQAEVLGSDPLVA